MEYFVTIEYCYYYLLFDIIVSEKSVIQTTRHAVTLHMTSMTHYNSFFFVPSIIMIMIIDQIRRYTYVIPCCIIIMVIINEIFNR